MSLKMADLKLATVVDLHVRPLMETGITFYGRPSYIHAYSFILKLGLKALFFITEL